MLQWLWVLSGMLMLFSLSLVLAFVIPGVNPAVRSAYLYTIMAGTQIVSTLYLLLNPSILFGMPRLEKMVGRLRLFRDDLWLDRPKNIAPEISSPIGIPFFSGPEQNPERTFSWESETHAESGQLPETAPSSVEEKESKPIPQRQYDDYIKLLKGFMEEKKPFLRKRYAINDLAKDLKIPQHHISYLLNNVFQIRYNDYINQFRIGYLKDRLAKGDLGHLTLEGLALEAGFSSRITFIRVVQKLTGMKPSEYFKLPLDETETVV
jgi:AraC-like DNA-binding protein